MTFAFELKLTNLTAKSLVRYEIFITGNCAFTGSVY